MNDPRDLDSIFLAAVDIDDPRKRAAFLQEACAADSQSRAKVEKLLAAHDAAGSFMHEDDRQVPTLDQQRVNEFEEGGEIGCYKLLQQIGEGGFGVVYMAEQQRPMRRKVALKIVKPGMDSRDVIARFEAERQALALMDHPNIAKVLDAGTTDSGRPFFVMELVKGVPVTEYCDKNRLDARGRLELFVMLCHAVQHAHQKGVIHRDIKPSNILVTLHDGKPVPKVIDFGVSKALNQQLTEKTLFTRYGQMIGTPQYMSPEQAEMSGLDVDTRSDIFSLGVVLYELLTGQTPLEPERLREAGFVEMQRIIQNDDPPRPSVRLSTLGDELTVVAKDRSIDPGKLRQTIQGELDWIVMKALEKDRGRRYESACSFADDVQRYLSDEPIEACPPSTTYHLRKFARRHRGAVVAASAVLTALLLGALLATGGMINANTHRRRAERESSRADTEARTARALAEAAKEAQQKAEAIAQQLEELTYAQRIKMAYQHVRASRPIDALNLLRDCPEYQRDFEWNLVHRLCHDEGRQAVPVSGRISSISARAANNSLGASVEDRVVAGLHNGRVEIFDASLAQDPLKFSFHPKSRSLEVIRWVQLSPTQDILAAASDSRSVILAHLKTGTRIHELPEDRLVTSVTFSPDGRLLASVGGSNEVRLWDIATGTLESTFSLEDSWAWAVCFSPDGEMLAAAGVDGEIRVWDLKTGESKFNPRRDHWAPVTSLCFSPDGKQLASASFDLYIRVLDADSGVPIRQWKAGKTELSCLAYNPAGSRLASVSQDGTLTIWDAKTFTELLVLRDHDEDPKAVAFSSDGQKLFSGGTGSKLHIWDGTVWDESLERKPLILEGFESRVLALAISPDGSELAAGGEDGSVKTWQLPSGKPKQSFQRHGDHGVVFTLAYDQDGQHVFSSGGGGQNESGGDDGLHIAIRWNVSNGVEDYRIDPQQTGAMTLAVNPAGDRLVTTGYHGELAVWEIPSRRMVGVLGRHERQVGCVLFSPNRRHLVSASEDRIIKLWDARRLDDAQTGETILRCKGQWFAQMDFDPAGSQLVVGDGNEVLLYDIEQRRLVYRLPGHGDPVNGTVFSSDGKLIASGSTDGTIKLWDAESGILLETLLAEGAVYRVMFTPDGAWLASAGEDTNVKLWNLSFLQK